MQLPRGIMWVLMPTSGKDRSRNGEPGDYKPLLLAELSRSIWSKPGDCWARYCRPDVC